MRMRPIVLVCLALAAAARSAHGQRSAPADTIVEVIGLEHRTMDVVRESLRRIRPGISLADAACAVLLRDSLGFADAAVETRAYPDTVWTTLSVVEPENASRVRFLPPPPDSLPTRPAWRPALELFRRDIRVLGSLQSHDFLRGATDSVFGAPAGGAAIQFRDVIRELASTADHDALVRTLRTDRNRDNRLIATLLLAHFPERDATWQALVRALRGPSSFARSVTGMLMVGMARAEDRDVDWRPAEDDLRHLLAGTNLFAYLEVLEVLARTKPEPALARRLIRAEPDLLLANLRSRNPSRGRIVRLFLSRVTDDGFGDDTDAWADWVKRIASM